MTAGLTAGRIVHYRIDGQCHAAIVVTVSQYSANLCLFLPGARTESRTVFPDAGELWHWPQDCPDTHQVDYRHAEGGWYWSCDTCEWTGVGHGTQANAAREHADIARRAGGAG